jgi:hypothetical protein
LVGLGHDIASDDRDNTGKRDARVGSTIKIVINENVRVSTVIRHEILNSIVHRRVGVGQSVSVAARKATIQEVRCRTSRKAEVKFENVSCGVMVDTFPTFLPEPPGVAPSRSYLPAIS